MIDDSTLSQQGQVLDRVGWPAMDTAGMDEKEPKIEIRYDPRPGDLGYITYLHGILYANAYGFDHTFEAYVAGPLAEFVKSRTERERLWIVEKNGKIIGSVAIVKFSEQQAQLRWLLLHPDLRGYGIGRKLVEEAIEFCRNRGYVSIFLWTVSALTAASRLYKSVGFQLAEDKTRELWGTVVTEEKYELPLK